MHRQDTGYVSEINKLKDKLHILSEKFRATDLQDVVVLNRRITQLESALLQSQVEKEVNTF